MTQNNRAKHDDSLDEMKRLYEIFKIFQAHRDSPARDQMSDEEAFLREVENRNPYFSRYRFSVLK